MRFSLKDRICADDTHGIPRRFYASDTLERGSNPDTQGANGESEKANNDNLQAMYDLSHGPSMIDIIQDFDKLKKEREKQQTPDRPAPEKPKHEEPAEEPQGESGQENGEGGQNTSPPSGPDEPEDVTPPESGE